MLQPRLGDPGNVVRIILGKISPQQQLHPIGGIVRTNRARIKLRVTKIPRLEMPADLPLNRQRAEPANHDSEPLPKQTCPSASRPLLPRSIQGATGERALTFAIAICCA